MVKVIFLRHGYSQYNKTKQYAGQLDIPLEPEGYEQARQGCRYILDNYAIDVVYSSDLSRAVETVKPIADKLGLEIIKRKDLREINLGKWQGQYIADVPILFEEDYKIYSEGTGRSTDGEGYCDVRTRAMNILTEIYSRYDGKTVVAGTHGGFVRALLWLLDDGKTKLTDIPGVSNASITVVSFENGKGRVELLGYNDYLMTNDENAPTE